LGISTVGFFDPKTGLSVSAVSTQVTTGKMLMLAQSSFHSVTPNNLTNDFIGIRFVLDQVIRKSTTKSSWGTKDAMKKSTQGGLNPTSPTTKLNIWTGK
jgi:hypothetical protein